MSTETKEVVANLLPGEQPYKFKCLSSKKERTKDKGKGTCVMFVQEFEITGHAKDELNGVKIPYWCVLHPKMLANVNRQRSSLGLPTISSISDYDSLDALDYVGLEGYALAKEESREKTNEVTGEPIINPNTQKPMTTSQNRITDWCARE